MLSRSALDGGGVRGLGWPGVNPPLEDDFADVLGKALRGQGLGTAPFASLLAGTWDEALAREACRVSGLNFPALRALALERRPPDRPRMPSGLAAFPSSFGEMTVNAYLVWDGTSRQAAAFDTGGDATALLRTLEENELSLRGLWLTHTHGDHIFEMDRVVEQTGCRVWVNEREPLAGAEPFNPGRTFVLGSLRIESRAVPGHSPGGTAYHVHGLEAPVIVTGDALFAGSVGKIREGYHEALAAVRREILSGQDQTLLCPGHGPMTTVAWELRHNPFFA